MKFTDKQKHYSLDSKPQSRMSDYPCRGTRGLDFE